MSSPSFFPSLYFLSPLPSPSFSSCLVLSSLTYFLLLPSFLSFILSTLISFLSSPLLNLFHPFSFDVPHLVSFLLTSSPLLFSFLLLSSSCFLPSLLVSPPLASFRFLSYPLLFSPTLSCRQYLQVPAETSERASVWPRCWRSHCCSNVNSSNEKIPRRAQHHLLAGLLWINWSHKWNLSCKARTDIGKKVSAATLPPHWLKVCSRYKFTRQQFSEQFHPHIPEIWNRWKWKNVVSLHYFHWTYKRNGAVLNRPCHLWLPMFQPEQ